LSAEVAERKYNVCVGGGGGAGARGCKAAKYPHEVSMWEGQKLGGVKPPQAPPPPPSSAALALRVMITNELVDMGKICSPELAE